MSKKEVPFLPQDFAACSNYSCPLRQTCWRTRAHPEAKRQTWAAFAYSPDVGCPNFLETPEAK